MFSQGQTWFCNISLVLAVILAPQTLAAQLADSPCVVVQAGSLNGLNEASQWLSTLAGDDSAATFLKGLSIKETQVSREFGEEDLSRPCGLIFFLPNGPYGGTTLQKVGFCYLKPDTPKKRISLSLNNGIPSSVILHEPEEGRYVVRVNGKDHCHYETHADNLVTFSPSKAHLDEVRPYLKELIGTSPSANAVSLRIFFDSLPPFWRTYGQQALDRYTRQQHDAAAQADIPKNFAQVLILEAYAAASLAWQESQTAEFLLEASPQQHAARLMMTLQARPASTLADSMRLYSSLGCRFPEALPDCEIFISGNLRLSEQYRAISKSLNLQLTFESLKSLRKKWPKDDSLIPKLDELEEQIQSVVNILVLVGHFDFSLWWKAPAAANEGGMVLAISDHQRLREAVDSVFQRRQIRYEGFQAYPSPQLGTVIYEIGPSSAWAFSQNLWVGASYPAGRGTAIPSMRPILDPAPVSALQPEHLPKPALLVEGNVLFVKKWLSTFSDKLDILSTLNRYLQGGRFRWTVTREEHVLRTKLEVNEAALAPIATQLINDFRDANQNTRNAQP